MNVTPLIDVLLVLLIIFMIITPNDPHGLNTVIPQPKGKSEAVDAPIVLQIMQTPKGPPSLAINQQKIEWAELKDRLLGIYKFRPDGVLFVKGDADVDFEYVAQAIDLANSANVHRVGLIPAD